MQEKPRVGEWVKQNSDSLERRYKAASGMYVSEIVRPSLGIYHIEQQFPRALRYWSEYQQKHPDGNPFSALRRSLEKSDATVMGFSDPDEEIIKYVTVSKIEPFIRTSIVPLKGENIPKLQQCGIDESAYLQVVYVPEGITSVVLNLHAQEKDPFDDFEPWQTAFPALLNYIRTEDDRKLELIRLSHETDQLLTSTEEISVSEAMTYARSLTEYMTASLELDRTETLQTLSSFGWFEALTEGLLSSTAIAGESSITEYLKKQDINVVLSTEVGLNCKKMTLDEERIRQHILIMDNFTREGVSWVHEEIEYEFGSLKEKRIIWQTGVTAYEAPIPVQDMTCKVERNHEEDGEFLIFSAADYESVLWSSSAATKLDSASIREIAEDRDADFRSVNERTPLYFVRHQRP